MPVSIGIVPKEEAPTFYKINKIRNDFAHNPQAIFSSKDAADLLNCLSPLFRRSLGDELPNYQDSLDALREVTASAFFYLQSTVSSMRDNRATGEIMHEMVEEMRKHHPPQLGKSKTDIEIEEHLSEHRERRKELGLL